MNATRYLPNAAMGAALIARGMHSRGGQVRVELPFQGSRQAA